MAIQVITHDSGRQMVVGSRRHPVTRPRGLSFKSYLLARLAPPPDELILWDHASAPFLKKVLLNDQLGCCTISGAFHLAGAMLANVGGDVPFTDDDVKRVYEGACGYVDGDSSTDQGGNETDVLNWIVKNGLLADGSHKFTSHMYVDATNPTEVKQAHYINEGTYWGVALPDEWVAMMRTLQDGDVWDVAGPPNPENGHCFAGLGHLRSNGNYLIDTWGFELYLTPAAAAKYAVPSAGGECHTILSEDMISKISGKTADGFDLAQLLADQAAIAA